MMARQVQGGRGLALEQLLKPPDWRSVYARYRAVERPSSYFADKWQDRRGISTSSFISDKRFPRYFWPTRPDFLPTKQIESANNSSRREESRAEDMKKIKVYLPTSKMKLALPTPSEVPQGNRALCNALLLDQSQATLWSLFQEHVQQVKSKGDSPLELSLFDGLFWSIASTEERNASHWEQLSQALTVLQEYADDTGHFGLTRLQLHRLIFVKKFFSEDKARTSGSLVLHDYLTKLGRQRQYMHAALVGQIIEQMLEHCDNSAKLGTILELIKEFHDHQSADIQMTLRAEDWSSSSTTIFNVTDIFFPNTAESELLKMTKYRLLRVAGNLPASEEVLDAVLVILTHHEEDVDPDRVIHCLKSFDKKSLSSLLPREMTEDLDGKTIAPETVETPSILSRAKVDEIRQKGCPALMQAIAASLAFREDCGYDYRMATYLFDKSISRKGKGDVSEFEISLCVAAVKAIAYHAQKSETADQVLPLLIKATSILYKTRWIDSRLGILAVQDHLDALLNFKPKMSMDATKSKHETKWSRLLQKNTAIILAADPGLATLSEHKHRQLFAPLLRTLIDVKDYAFAKRIYIIESKHSERRLASSLPLSFDQFLWFFQASLTIDSDLKLARLLFTHWESAQYDRQSAHYLPNLPSSLLRMYFGKLIASGRKEGIHTLQRLLDSDRGSSFALDYKNESRSTARHNAVRTCRMAFHVGKEQVDDALGVASTIIERWQSERQGGFEKMSTLIELYAIALEKSTVWLDQSTPLSRARILLVFEAFREHFGLIGESRGTIPSSPLQKATQRHVQIIYRCAFETLLRHKQGPCLRRDIELNVQDLMHRWKISIGADIYGARVAAYSSANDDNKCDEEDLARAIEILEEGIDMAQKHQEFLPPNPVAKLINILTTKSDYIKADRVFQMYKTHTQGEPKSTIIMVEAAGIVLAHHQGRRLEAFWRLQDLIREVQEVDQIPNSVKWTRTLRSVERLLRKGDAEEIGDEPGNEINQEEQDRLRAFGALAGGQPYRWRWSRNKDRDLVVV